MAGIALPVMADADQFTDEGQYAVERTVTASSALVEPPLFRAEPWGLEEAEWQRYQSLLQGIRGSVSPTTLSPVEVLGIHARTDEERRRYAEQWAVMMHDDAARILAFQQAYDDAQRRLFADSTLIDGQALAAWRAHQTQTVSWQWRRDDRVLFFADTQCPTCDAVLARLIGQLQHFAGIDLYLRDVSAGDEARIREWAAAQQIDPHWVSAHKITLNIEAGALQQVAAHTGQQGQTLPVLVLRRQGQLSPLPPLPMSRF